MPSELFVCFVGGMYSTGADTGSGGGMVTLLGCSTWTLGASTFSGKLGMGAGSSVVVAWLCVEVLVLELALPELLPPPPGVAGFGLGVIA